MTINKSRNITFNLDLFDSLSAHIAVVDPDGIIVETNSSWATIML
jgi:hypothetical protein